MSYTVTTTLYINRHKLLGKLPNGDVILIDERNDIKKVDSQGNTTSTSGKVPSGFSVTRMLILSTGTMLLFGDNNNNGKVEVLRSTNSTYSSFTTVYTAQTGRVLERGADKNENDVVLMVEYSTASRDSVPVQHVVRGTNDGQTWEVVQQFNRSSQYSGDTTYIRHLHTACYDPYEQKFWVGAGDNDPESKVFRTIDGATLELIGGGDQMWRSVSFEFTGDYIVWGGDATEVQNYMVRLNRDTLEREILEPVAGPIYITTKIPTKWGNFIISSSCVEGSITEWDNRSHVYLNTDGEGLVWDDVISWQISGAGGRPRIYNATSDGMDTIYLWYYNILDQEGNSYPSYVTVVLKIIREQDPYGNDLYKIVLVQNKDGKIEYVNPIINKDGKTFKINSIVTKL
jgi:hypothetical protein